MAARHAPPSLRTELLANLAVLAAGALAMALVTVVLFYAVGGEPNLPLLVLLVAADLCVFVVFGAYLLRRLLLQPLAAVAAAAEDIAAGDLARRVPEGSTRELIALARSVNRMTDRLLEERTQLVRVEKLASIGRLAAGVAHEIGNPLGAMHGYTHLLRAQVHDRPAATDALAGLERETARIDRIVRGMLDYARPRRAPRAPVDVNQVARSVIDLLREQGTLRGVDVALDLAPSPLVVHGDAHELEQLFVNLLLNAVDALAEQPPGGRRVGVHTECISRGELSSHTRRRAGDATPGDPATPREPTPRVRLWLEHADDQTDAAKIVVADSGPGVPSDDAERIFDPFFTTKDPGRGTGLGLAIVARVVDTLRGTIWVDRAREGGAAFHLLLPLAPERSIPTPTRPAERPAGSAAP